MLSRSSSRFAGPWSISRAELKSMIIKRRHVLGGVLAIVAMAWTPICADAQSTGTISGVVLDPSQSVVVDAAVTLRSDKLHDERETKTDSQGSFRFENVPYGGYDLGVQMEGFAAGKARVNV